MTSLIYHKFVVETVKSLKEKGTIWVQQDIRHQPISSGVRFYCFIYVTLFHFMNLLSRHPNTKSQNSVLEHLHMFWQFCPYNGWGQGMKHPGPLYPGLHSEKNHSPITCSILILYFHHSVTMGITIKTFHNHL